MTEIRFPLRGRGSRRDADAEIPADPLEDMALQIRALDAAAEMAAARIAEAAAGLGNRERGGGSATRADLLAGLASALVDRTEEIRADCGRLSALMDRTAKLVADRDSADSESSTPDPKPFSPAQDRDLEPIEPAPLPESLNPPDPDERDERRETRDEPEPRAESREPRDPSPEPEPSDATEAKPTWLSGGRGAATSTSEGVRLIATQMAIAGSSRAEIERRLRTQFGVIDADQALDEIFGHRRTGVG